MPRPRLKIGDISIAEVLELSRFVYRKEGIDNKAWRAKMDVLSGKIIKRNNLEYNRSTGKCTENVQGRLRSCSGRCYSYKRWRYLRNIGRKRWQSYTHDDLDRIFSQKCSGYHRFRHLRYFWWHSCRKTQSRWICWDRCFFTVSGY